MGTHNNSKETHRTIREEWNDMVNRTARLIPGDKGILFRLDNQTIEMAVKSGGVEQFLTELKGIKPDLNINPHKIDFGTLPYEYLLILKVLVGESGVEESIGEEYLIEGVRSGVKNIPANPHH